MKYCKFTFFQACRKYSHTKNQYSYLRKRIQVIKVTKDLSDLNDQHVLSEVIPLFEDYSNRCGGGRRWHGRELQPQRLLL